jgi:branched-chain amino acid transport system ATP-binding protein
MLEIRHLNAWYGAAQALFEVQLQVDAGEMVVLQGLNGAGKSTLLQSITGIGPRTAGEVNYCGQALQKMPAHLRVQCGLGYVPEDRRLFAELTVRENLMVAARPDRSEARGSPLPATLPQRLDYVLAVFPVLQTLLGRPAAQMSGGEQQMLSIARTLMTRPSLLLLDEPCEGIAPVLVESIREALLKLLEQGMPMLIAEQNAALADHATRVITLVAGRIANLPIP